MTTIKEKLRLLEVRRENATLFGGVMGLAAGFIFYFDFLAALFSGAAGSLICWYFASLAYWEYRDSLILNRRDKWPPKTR